MIELQKVFDVTYGNKLNLNKMTKTVEADGIHFVSRTSKNNGVSAIVKAINQLEPYAEGMITVALGGSILSSFVQNKPFYTGQNVAVLKPIISMTLPQKLFYCKAIHSNAFRFSAFGREANRFLKTMLIPSHNEIPDWVNNFDILKYENTHDSSLKTDPPELNFKDWKYFTFSDIFSIKQGYYNKKPPTSPNKNDIPFIGASEQNNGITSYIKKYDVKNYSRTGKIISDEPLNKKLFSPNCITVANDGSVSQAFYQTKEFTCSHSVNIIYLKYGTFSPEVGLFIAALIKKEKYRWSYGRKWRPARMEKSKIKLPVDDNGNPDWQFMENYIKSLPYSSSL